VLQFFGLGKKAAALFVADVNGSLKVIGHCFSEPPEGGLDFVTFLERGTTAVIVVGSIIFNVKLSKNCSTCPCERPPS